MREHWCLTLVITGDSMMLPMTATMISPAPA